MKSFLLTITLFLAATTVSVAQQPSAKEVLATDRPRRKKRIRKYL